MKNESILNLKQEEMAMLLQITRSQWSMYVLGKRDLPIEAKLKLTEILNFMQQQKVSKITMFNKVDIKKTQNVLIKWETKNLLQQKTTLQKLDLFNKKQKNAQTTLQLIDFLNHSDKNPNQRISNLLEMMRQNAKFVLEKNNLVLKTELELKLKTLKFEEKQIFSAFKKL